MASIRKMCIHDLLHMNDLLMGQNYGSSLYHYILRYPEYALVAVSPSNRITGFITGRVQVDGADMIFVIAGMFGDAGLPETGDMLIEAIIEKAEQLGEHGFIWDGEQPEGSTKRLRKDLSQDGGLEAHVLVRRYSRQK